MAKRLNKISDELKEFIYESHKDAHNQKGFNKYRYNNLVVEIPELGLEKIPQIKISMGLSEAIFDLNTFEKLSGSLGPDENYVLRWLRRDAVMAKLIHAYKSDAKLKDDKVNLD